MATIAVDPWLADAWLAPDIRPGARVADGNHLLLTGATGFLGRHLLKALLERDSGDVYCLSRRGPGGDARTRIERALEDVGGSQPSHRLRILEADLSAPRLGLPRDEYAELSQSVSTILHCAADVSWSRCYSKLRDSNVLPVTELLRLACHGPAKHMALISSLAVCYSTDEHLYTAEHTDPSSYLSTIPLGYAQSKAIAERLVRQAVGRGLSASIFRPALITGDRSGAHANAEDFVSWVLGGCIRMGWAPDVDWRLDVVPVDFVAAVITANLERPDGLHTLHIANSEPRSWRELVLFLNLYGYTVRLESFDHWRERLLAFPDAMLPLRRFLGFFTDRAGSAGLTVAQVYEAGGRPRISHAHSEALLATQGLTCPKLDAEYFSTYLSTLERLRVLEAPKRATAPRRRREELSATVLRALQPTDPRWQPAPLRVSGSITTEIVSWRHGGPIGLYGVCDGSSGARDANLILKIKARDSEVIETSIAVAEIASPRLGRLFEHFSHQLAFDGASDREVALYATACPELIACMPRCHAVGQEPSSGRAMLLLERLQAVELMDSVNRPQDWTDAHLRAAVRDLARVHAVAYAREPGAETALTRLQVPDPHGILEATPLWRALRAFGEPFHRQWGGQGLTQRIERLIEDAPSWVPAYAAQPRSVIHNDCNPRNLAFRRRGAELQTCLYDWELCTRAPPQRDLAELLCFTLDAARASEKVYDYVDQHRRAVCEHSGTRIDARLWLDGFRLSLAEFMLRRLLMYSMLHAYVRQPYLPRVMRTWLALDEALRR